MVDEKRLLVHDAEGEERNGGVLLVFQHRLLSLWLWGVRTRRVKKGKGFG